jgi:hypothetical protein
VSDVIVLDPRELNEAAPRVTELHLNLVDAQARVAGLDLGVEMPPGVRGRVAAHLDAARSRLTAAARSVDGLGADIARRAGLAELADRLTTIWLAAGPLAASAGVATAFHRDSASSAAKRGNLEAARAYRRYAQTSQRLTRLLGAVGKLVGYGPATIADVRNPFLTTDQKLGRIAGRATTSAAAGAVERAAVGTAARLAIGRGAGTVAVAALGGPVGLAVGLTWTVLDYKLDLSGKVADGATWAIDKAGDGAQWLDDHALDPAGDFVADRADEALEVADDAVDVADDALDAGGNLVDKIIP